MDQAYSLCALSVLTTLHAASGDGSVAPGAPDPGAAALFSWGDLDRDGRLDLAALADGTLRILVDAGEGRFADVTAAVGLAGIENAALALWADHDANGWLDLFVGAREGASRLFHNDGGLFTDVSAASGLASEGPVRSAAWLDHDGDGRLDLFVVSAHENALFRGLEGGFFERLVLPGPAASAPAGSIAPAATPTLLPAPDAAGTPDEDGSLDSRATLDGGRPSGGRAPLGPPPSVGSVTPLVAFPVDCASSIRDQANPTTCLMASTTPALGRLHPLSSNLFVTTSGRVGIGTTTPSARLEVGGTAQIDDTLTLFGSPMALDVGAYGNIHKGGALFIHTKGFSGNTAVGREALANPSFYTGVENTALGDRALFSTTSGSRNAAVGSKALYANTTGTFNTASGYRALSSNTYGGYNTASGHRALGANTTGAANTATGASALLANTTGGLNVASGMRALSSNTTGFGNTATGFMALYLNTAGYHNTACGRYALFQSTGSDNIAIGVNAGGYLTTGNRNIAIGSFGAAGESSTIRIGTPGNHTRAFVAGIRSTNTGVADAIPVLIDSAGQLGTISSSRRFKEDIEDMGGATERLLALRPVTFRYKPDVQSGERPLEYGLIAEEVAEVFPELVVFDEEGEPFTVKYHLLSAMLLNELKALHARVESFEAELGQARAAAVGGPASGR